MPIRLNPDQIIDATDEDKDVRSLAHCDPLGDALDDLEERIYEIQRRYRKDQEDRDNAVFNTAHRTTLEDIRSGVRNEVGELSIPIGSMSFVVYTWPALIANIADNIEHTVLTWESDEQEAAVETARFALIAMRAAVTKIEQALTKAAAQ